MATKNKDDAVQDVTAKPAPGAPAPVDGLDDLARQAEGLEKQATQAGQAQAEKQAKQETDTLAHDLADALGMAAAVGGPMIWWLTPEQFEQLWGDKVRKNIADAGAEIMRRHGLSMGDVMSKYGPYIGLAGALGPSVIATAVALKRKRQELITEQGASDGTAPSKAG